MLGIPHIARTEPRPAAVIHLVIPRADIQQVMGPAIAEIFGAIAAQGVTAVGPVFAHHLKMSRTTFDFEVGVPTSRPIIPAGRVFASELPGGIVAQTTYRGPYERLYDAWQEFGAWVAEQGHTPAPHLWEIYVTGPESSNDPSTWLTELNQPLLSVGP